MTILYEDNHLLVVNKPAGWLVQGDKTGDQTLIDWGKSYLKEKYDKPGAVFLHPAHRIDRPVSGAVLFARTDKALSRLTTMFRDKKVQKTYLALVVGKWPGNKKVLDKPLVKFLLPGKDGQDGERRVRVTAKDDPDGMKSVTLVKVVQRLERQGAEFTQLEVTIKTGRTHQIRVHLASEGFPIAGDDKYGVFEVNKALQKQGLKRMYLHAWRLQFTHPATGERCELHAALPTELAQFVPVSN